MTLEELQNKLGRKLKSAEIKMYNLMCNKENYKIEVLLSENTFRFVLITKED